MTQGTGEQGLVVGTGMWPETRNATSLGLMVPVSERAAFSGTPHFGDIIEVCRTAADVGFEMLWFADHFTFGDTAKQDWRGAWDAWTLMAGVAAAVPNVQIGPLVACTAYRNPGVIAKMAENIDDISGGRFILGLGAGWHKPEYDHFGIPFEPRVTRFEEALRIIHPLLRTGSADFQGTHYQANEALNVPRGPRPDGPPFLIGSSGPRMLRLLAQYGDAWNCGWRTTTAQTLELSARLDAACSDVGRDPRTVVRTVGVNIAGDDYTGSRPDPLRGDAAAKIARLTEFRDLGFRHIICGLDACTPASVAAFRDVVEGYHAN